MTRTGNNTRPQPPSQRLGFLLYRVGSQVATAYAEMIRPLGFSPVEIGLMTYLATSGESHIRSIARVLGVSPQTLVNASVKLEKRRLIRREKPMTKGLPITLSMTDKGSETFLHIDATVREFDEGLESLLGGALTTRMVAGLRRLLAD